MAKSADLNLGEFMDHASKPKAVKKPEKPSKSPGLPRYRPAPFPESPTPDGVVLFWRITECQCGRTFEGPKFGNNSCFYRVKRKTASGNCEKWDFIPKFLHDTLDSSIPFSTITTKDYIHSCPSCYDKHVKSPDQMDLPLLERKEEALIDYYRGLLQPPSEEPKAAAGQAPTALSRSFKEDVQEIMAGGAAVGTLVGESIAETLLPILTLKKRDS